MTRARNATLTFLLALLAASVSAQPTGRGRINGKILDDQGKPAQDVQVRAVKVGETLTLEAKTNSKGEWVLNGLAGGQWNFEFVKNGYDSQRMTVAITEDRNPPIDMKLTKAAAAVDPNAELQDELKKALALQEAGKHADARKIYETLLAKYPTVYQLNSYIAGTYATEKNYDKAIEYLKVASEKEPANGDLKLVMADLLMEKGDKAEAEKLLQTVDMTQVKDPTLFINMAIGAINGGKPEEAIAVLDKVNKQFPTRADVFYYRGRANIVAKKMPEAKADLEKFVSMAAPDARELPDAKKLLEQLKDVK
jgi:predicted Zn-dependent protease